MESLGYLNTLVGSRRRETDVLSLWRMAVSASPGRKVARCSSILPLPCMDIITSMMASGPSESITFILFLGGGTLHTFSRWELTILKLRLHISKAEKKSGLISSKKFFFIRLLSLMRWNIRGKTILSYSENKYSTKLIRSSFGDAAGKVFFAKRNFNCVFKEKKIKQTKKDFCRERR